MGPVEEATAAMIKKLGHLSPSRKVTAATATRLSALLDTECDGSKAAALSARLLVAISALTATAVTAPAIERPDPIVKLQDDLARKRRERQA